MKLLTELYPHQRAAYDKLINLRIGALYMEMGTGKTRTALEFIHRRLETGRIKQVIWLCPCSVRGNLLRDIRKHAQGTEVIRIMGIESLSNSTRIHQELMAYVQAAPTMMIVDESNLVKNNRAWRSVRITQAAAYCPYRMILNGTPISKTEADLFAQWYILDWRILGYRSFWSFAANHLEYDAVIPGKIVRALNVDYLTRKIAPYTYQVLKEDLAMQLPEKRYMRYGYELGRSQRDMYDFVAEEMIGQLDERKPSTIYCMFSALQAVISGRWVKDDGVHMVTGPLFDKPGDNPRIQALQDLLPRLEDGAKVIIFCKYRHEIEDVLASLAEDGHTAVPFYGRLSQQEREESLIAFAGSAQYLVANKACAGYGLNLQFCHQVVYYSNDWDYATRIQSEDRVHRFGQEHTVMIYDLYAYRTLDARILACLERKESLVAGFKERIGQMKDNNALKSWLTGVDEKEDTHGAESISK